MSVGSTPWRGNITSNPVLRSLLVLLTHPCCGRRKTTPMHPMAGRASHALPVQSCGLLVRIKGSAQRGVAGA